jgi:dTMP kinase
MLITFEGVEGSGKTTQVELLAAYLQEKGYKVLKTREPGGTALGEALRRILLQKDLHVVPLSELLVFMAVRAQHMEEVIMPALARGEVILCDRFADATHVYQGYGRGVDFGIIATLNRLVTKGVTPNLTVLLDCEVTTGFGRKVAAKDRFEEEEAAFHERIRRGYIELAKEEPKRFFVIDGKGDVKAIHETIRSRVEQLLESHGV